MRLAATERAHCAEHPVGPPPSPQFLYYGWN